MAASSFFYVNGDSFYEIRRTLFVALIFKPTVERVLIDKYVSATHICLLKPPLQTENNDHILISLTIFCSWLVEHPIYSHSSEKLPLHFYSVCSHSSSPALEWHSRRDVFWVMTSVNRIKKKGPHFLTHDEHPSATHYISLELCLPDCIVLLFFLLISAPMGAQGPLSPC